MMPNAIAILYSSAYREDMLEDCVSPMQSIAGRKSPNLFTQG
jgi:hypothetical protein